MNNLSYSIDTIRIIIPCNNADRLKKARLYAFFEADNEEQSIKEYFYLSSPENIDRIESSWTPPVITIVERDENGLEQELRPPIDGYSHDIIVQFSVPKMTFGHSSRMAIGTLKKFFCTYHDLLQAYSLDPSPVSLWRVHRLDFCYNFDLGNLENVDHALSQISRVKFYGKSPVVDGRGKPTCTWPGQKRVVKFYGKYREMLHNKADYPDYFVAENEDLLKPILRYEEEWRARYIVRTLKKKSLLSQNEGVYNLTVPVVMDYLENHYKLEDHLQKVRSQFLKKAPAANLTKLFKKLKSVRRSKEIEDFCYYALDNGMVATKKKYSKSAYYRHRSKLASLGLSADALESHFDEVWGQPLDLLEFVSLDNMYYGTDHIEIHQNPMFEDFQFLYNGGVFGNFTGRSEDANSYSLKFTDAG